MALSLAGARLIFWSNAGTIQIAGKPLHHPAVLLLGGGLRQTVTKVLARIELNRHRSHRHEESHLPLGHRRATGGVRRWRRPGTRKASSPSGDPSSRRQGSSHCAETAGGGSVQFCLLVHHPPECRYLSGATFQRGSSLSNASRDSGVRPWSFVSSIHRSRSRESFFTVA